MQIKDSTRCVIEKENWSTQYKNISMNLKVGNDLLENELGYKNMQKPSKFELLNHNVLEIYKLQLPMDFLESCF